MESLAGRILFGLCLFLSLGKVVFNTVGHERLMYWEGARFELLNVIRGSGMTLLVSAIYATAAVLFCTGTMQPGAAVVLIVATALARRRYTAMWPGDTVVNLGFYQPSIIVLFGWLVGWALFWGHPDQLRAAWEGAIGVMAATYVMAAISKYREGGGLKWISARNMALLVAERSYAGWPWLRQLRRAAAASPGFMKASAFYGFWVEAAAVLYLVPEFRYPIANAALLLQGGILILLGYIELEWMIIMFALPLLAGSV